MKGRIILDEKRAKLEKTLSPNHENVSGRCHQGSISSTFYSHIFRTKVCSKPNSKQKKAAQKTFVRKMCT